MDIGAYRGVSRKSIYGETAQESRKFGSMITARAKIGVRGLPSAVLSYMRLFSSDRILWAKRLGEGARLQE